MDVLLINPQLKFGKGIYRAQRTTLPLGLLAVATPLDAAGYTVKILDQQKDPAWKKSLLDALAENPLCVGITVKTGPQIRYALKASRIIKENSDIPVVWGGVHPSLLPEQTLENENIDIIVQGEGEATFLELVRSLEKKTPILNVKGLWFKDKSRIIKNPVRPFIDLNLQHPLAYHLLDVNGYLENRYGNLYLKTFTSRGCQHPCTFCYNTNFNRCQWRAITAEESVKRLKSYVERYSIKGFIFADDNFFGDVSRARQILQGIKREKLDVLLYKLDIRVDVLFSLDDDFLRLLKDNGCVSLSIGVESGSERILKLLQKKISLQQLDQINKRLDKAGIIPNYTFMMGYPTETREELAATIKLMFKLLQNNPSINKALHVYTPLPGTELFELAVKHGLQVPQKLEDWIPFNYRMINLPWASKEQKELIEMLHFCTILLGKNTFFNPSIDMHPFFRLLGKLYRPLATWRIKNLNARLPLEIKLAERLHLYHRQNN